VAAWSWDSLAADELSFSAGDHLIILGPGQDEVLCRCLVLSCLA